MGDTPSDHSSAARSSRGDNVRLEVQEGTSSNGEVIWKDAGPICLLDDLASTAPTTTTNTSQSVVRSALPKTAKEWLLSTHPPKTKKERQDLYLYRLAPQNGPNTNVFLFLHGAGDSHFPFDRLGKTMALAQTATLSLNAKVCGVALPFDLGYSWFHEMDYSTGDPLSLDHKLRQSSLREAVAYMQELLTRLSELWPSEHIFMLGYGSGATLALQLCRWWTRPPLGGVICVGGATDSTGGNNGGSNDNPGTPILLLSHNSWLLSKWKEEYESVRGTGVAETFLQTKAGMIAGPDEMEAVMKFLGPRLVLSTQLATTR